jgi:iron complex transport system ATP-binding protein
MLAKLLAQDAPIMLLDEPTTHLDLPSSLELMHMLQRLARDFKKTIIFTSHELHLVFKMAQTVVLLGGDGTYAYGSPIEVAQHSLMCHFLRTDEISVVDGNLQFKISES